MSQDPEEIRQEMNETRDSLTDKISLLEQQVVQTVHGASEGVKDTVEAVKEAVQETVQSVKDTVGETVDNVKETFSVTCQVKQRPWVMMAGSVGVGFAVGYVLNAPAPARAKTSPSAAPQRRTGNGSHREHFAGSGEEPAPAAASSSFDTIAHLASMFESEINQLKGLAIGTLAGIVRDMVVDAAPEMMRGTLTQVINDFTTKFGGHPIQGKVFGDQDQNRDEERPAGSAQPSESSSFHKRQTMTLPN